MTTNDPALAIGDATDETQNTASVVAVSSCKLPQFWSIQPRLWFVQVEAALQVARITNDASRYNHIVSALDTDSMLQLADFLQNPPETDKYAKLKDEILKRFSESSDRQLHRALTKVQLDDKKPSQLLRQLRILMGDRASEDLLPIKWLALLPPSTSRCLKLLRDAPLDDLAEVADELMENQAGHSVMATHHQPAQAAHKGEKFENSLLTSMAKDVSGLKLAIADLVTCIKEQGITRDRPQAASGRLQQSSSKEKPASDRKKFCYYHRLYGSRAKKCERPCTFNSSTEN
ncbi:uncharacterized protein LOC126764657 [Bactrocera neohumeralis]|uniref:uncharacterized protein LOC126764657 n=1 Tax=Bactrocera neohumeralis TaxID=98809 RepID=UPI002165CDB1|nr:uncharacterized protein LOC126764657 [Bactrocera neohumeralis]